jgi:hypothetical protein
LRANGPASASASAAGRPPPGARAERHRFTLATRFGGCLHRLTQIMVCRACPAAKAAKLPAVRPHAAEPHLIQRSSITTPFMAAERLARVGAVAERSLGRCGASGKCCNAAQVPDCAAAMCPTVQPGAFGCLPRGTLRVVRAHPCSARCAGGQKRRGEMGHINDLCYKSAISTGFLFRRAGLGPAFPQSLRSFRPAVAQSDARRDLPQLPCAA